MNDFLSGFGGLMKGLSAFMPQDDPDVKLMRAGSDVGELERQEIELYAQIGKQVLETESGRFPELENKLKLLKENLSEAKIRLQIAQEEKKNKEAARRAEEEKSTCSACGVINPEGIKYCQECGAKLGMVKCLKCEMPLPPGALFCGECGTKQEG